MKSLLAIFISSVLVVSAYSQTRNVLVNSNNAVVQPTNFWSVDASNARTGLGLGSAATNPASAFQPSSLVLSNLASSNAVNLTNLRATNVVGTLSLTQGGTGATNAATARTAFGLDTAATNPASAFQPSSAVLSNLAAGSGIAITNIAASNIVGAVAVVNGGTGATNAATARTNLGLTWNALTNSNSTSFFNSILNTVDESSNIRIPSTTLISAGSSYSGIDPTNYDNVVALKYVSTDDDGTGGIPPDHDTWSVTSPSKFRSAIQIPLAALTNTNVSNFRSAIGIPLPALTNTNNVNFLASFFGANTNPVLVDTNGQVVSPTNFWQEAPIASTYQESVPVTNSTNLADSSRSLHLHSLSPSINNVTNVILLRTNGTTFAGDNATIVHKGPTSSMTVVRSSGSTNNLITLTRFNEAVKFVYYGSVWNLDHNLSFIEPIYFAGTNTANDAATSRTNLGIPLAALTNTNNANFQAAVFATNSNPTNAGNFNNHVAWMEVTVQTNGSNVSFRVPLYK